MFVFSLKWVFCPAAKACLLLFPLRKLTETLGRPLRKLTVSRLSPFLRTMPRGRPGTVSARARSRNWLVTVHRYTDAENPPGRWRDEVEYAIWQEEKAPSTDKLHLQMFLRFHSQVAASGVKAMFTSCPHVDIGDAKIDSMIAYCSKTETRVSGPWEHGIKPVGKGKRSDLLEMQELLDKGAEEMDIAKSFFSTWARNHRAVARYCAMAAKNPRSWVTYTEVWLGPPGCGKGARVQERWKPNEVYTVKRPGPGQPVYFDGYTGQPIVVLDEFNGYLPFHFLLKLCDAGPLLVDTKGGMAQFRARTVVIVSNHEVDTWYKNPDLPWPALWRRISEPNGRIVRFEYSERFPDPSAQPTYGSEVSGSVIDSLISPDKWVVKPPPSVVPAPRGVAIVSLASSSSSAPSSGSSGSASAVSNNYRPAQGTPGAWMFD